MKTPSGIWFQVVISDQRVIVWKGCEKLWEAPVSTAALGCGEVPNSFKTPRGWHRIAEKIGADAPIGTVFKARVPTGKIWKPEDPFCEEDLILTRILWLAGDEELNRTSYDRYIYFHGTNHPVGKPGSHGCIRLNNKDMIRLFDYAETGTRVEITESAC